MKIFIMLLMSNILFAQKDSLFKYNYIRLYPITLYSGSGYIQDKISQNLEIGKSIDFVDIGVAIGRSGVRTDSNGNNNIYIEPKLSMDVFQYGNISNEMVVGVGYVFYSPYYMMMEVSYTILLQCSKYIGVGITSGFVDYSGNNSDNYRNTFGIFVRSGLLNNEKGLFRIGTRRTYRGHKK